MTQNMITQNELKEILQYNENTGVFTWKQSPAKHIKIGDIAGSLDANGYTYIRINKKLYKAHRLSWLYVYGEWPKNQIDHINGVKNDNRVINLRDVTNRENHQNKKEHREGKLVGCNFHKKTQKWRAQIQINGRLKHLGYYNTELEAHEAYLKFLKQLDDNI